MANTKFGLVKTPAFLEVNQKLITSRLEIVGMKNQTLPSLAILMLAKNVNTAMTTQT